MSEQIVIFGASGGGERVARTLLSLNIDFSFLVDNDKKKWGQELEGKLICSPEQLLSDGCNYRIIIASEYQKEIEAQLEEMGLVDRIVEKEKYITAYVDTHLSDYEYLRNKDIIIHEEKRVFIDLLEGVKLGGVETWSFTVARGLLEHGARVQILSTKTDELPPENLINTIIDTDASYEDYWGTVNRIVDIITYNLPCAIIINKQTQALYAGYIAKHYFPNQVKLISVVHNDLISFYRRQNALIDYIDAVICVSMDIKERFIKEFDFPEEKLFYKESAVDFNAEYVKEYTLDSKKPICIGFAARIAKAQKRADLLIPLIKGLEEKHINYWLTIAGNGPYYPVIEEYVREKNLSDRVRLLGQINRESIKDFWKEQDLFISLSDYEGSSLSMLEAMSYGVVPVETNVSGANEFIKSGVNGFICETGNVSQILQYIIYLEQRRELLCNFGSISREKIRVKCNKDDYINYILDLVRQRKGCIS
ncbi:MAG: glycosyltransferase family 4 protein [Anaerocolumna sp.]